MSATDSVATPARGSTGAASVVGDASNAGAASTGSSALGAARPVTPATSSLLKVGDASCIEAIIFSVKATGLSTSAAWTSPET